MTEKNRRFLLQGAVGLAGAALVQSAFGQIVPVKPAPGIRPVGVPPPSAQPVPGGPLAPPGAGFLKTGVRLTYLQAGAQLAIPISSLVPDAKGRWKDARSGQVLGASNSGAGFLSADILRLDAAGMLCWYSLFGLNDPPNTTTVMIDALGVQVPGAGQWDSWVPPAQLAALADTDSAETKISREDFETAGRTFKTVNVQSFARNQWTQNIYDLETGLAVSTGIATSLPQGTNLQTSSLVSIRTPTLPGPGAAYPDAIKRLKMIVYKGDYGTAVAGASTIPPSPLEVKYEITGGDAATVLTTRTVTLSDQVLGQGPLLMPAGMPGSFWMDPAWLAARTAGETLDTDPNTGATVKCAGPYSGMMVISVTTAASTVYIGYDPASGMLKAVQGSDVNGLGTTTRRLNLSSAT